MRVNIEDMFLTPPSSQYGGKTACAQCYARRSELCGTLSDDELPALFDQARVMRVDKGGYLFMEDAPANFVYNVSYGVVMLERIASNGGRQVMAFSYPSDFIGLMVGNRYNISARALTSISVCRWDMRELERMFDQYPKLEGQLRIIGNRVLATTLDQIFVLGRKNAYEKLAFFLNRTQIKQEQIFHKQNYILLPMTRTDIADHLGLTIETISRAFSRFARDELIRLHTASKVEILDQSALTQAIDHYPV